MEWQRPHGRHDLPWQATRDPYRIWLSEVMLQQTQVTAVGPYYERFVARFPDVAALAAASEDEVLALWSGLGYYARARNLHRAAQQVVADNGGIFPSGFVPLTALPGVGRTTAAAIAVFASGEKRAILDGNVKRVIARHAGIAGDPSSPAVVARLWDAAEARLPARSIEAYTQGLMDLGALVCLVRAPLCSACPVAGDCVARRDDCVDDLPGKKRKAARRLERTAMLAIVSHGEVLLEKRRAAGIWGGLWSLPEMPASARPADFVRRRFGLGRARARKLDAFKHAFTHFTLAVTPWLVEIGVRPRTRPEPSRLGIGVRGLSLISTGCMWLPLDAIAGAALPAPVRRLLESLNPASAARRGSGAGSPGARKRR